MNYYNIFEYIVVALLIVTSFLLGKTVSQSEKLDIIESNYNNSLESFKMYYVDKYGVEFNYTNGVYGIAYGDFFTVWSRGRNITAVLDTCVHEYAHNNLGLRD